ncbi:MAG: zinc-ribbon domain-containing protein [Polyangiaceae bacterium]|nr:zinc-ribbon domain-containing protein [Polyangiaceae bacterium]
MKVNCPACSAKYTIADEKVLGRRVKVRCKTCGQPITVDGTQLEDPSGGLDAGDEDEATRIASVPSFGAQAAPDEAGDVWSVNVTETDQRSMTTAALADAYASGEIGADAFVWREGMADWLPIDRVPELAPPAAAPAAPPRAPVGRGPAARVSPSRASGQDLFGAPAPAAPAPAATSRPGASAYDDKPAGARNENSVLFSLDALKAGIPSKSETGAVKRPEKSSPSAGLDDLMNLGGGGANPLFTLASNQALLSAPAPPEPPPPPPPSLAAASGGLAPAAPARAKVPWVAIAAGGGVLAVVAIVAVVVLGGKKSEPVAQAPAAEPARTEATAAQPAPAKTEDPKPEPAKAEEPRAEEPAAGSAAPAGAESAGGEKREPTEEEKKRFADAKKAEEEKKKAEEEKKPETPAPTGGGAPFNKGAAVAALSSAASAASACKRPGGPTGTGRATVTFAPSGRATNATVSGGAFGGTSVGGCIASVFRRAKVPPFDGDPVTVGKSFTISE